MTVSSVTQRMSVHYGGSIENLEAVFTHISADVVVTGTDKKTFRLFSAVDVIVDKDIVTLEVKMSPHFIRWFIFIKNVICVAVVSQPDERRLLRRCSHRHSQMRKVIRFQSYSTSHHRRSYAFQGGLHVAFKKKILL